MRNYILLAVFLLTASNGCFAEHFRGALKGAVKGAVKGKDAKAMNFDTGARRLSAQGVETIKEASSLKTIGHKLRNLQERNPFMGKKAKKGKKGRMGNGNGNGNGNGAMKNNQPECRTVVEPVEFYMEPPLETVLLSDGEGNMTSANTTNATSTNTTGTNNTTVGNNTATNTTGNTTARRFLDGHLEDEPSPDDIGTRWIFQGPLMEFDEDEGLVDLTGFFVSGVCTRTWENDPDNGIPGAAYCTLALSIDTGASINVAGEVFDGWDSNVGIDGGTRELMGISGQMTFTPLNQLFQPLDMDEDFFEDSSIIRGRGTLVYDICPARYWRQAMNRFEELDSDDQGTFPDPFSMESSS